MGFQTYRACQRFVKAVDLQRCQYDLKLYCELRVDPRSKDHSSLKLQHLPGFKPDPTYRILPGDPRPIDKSLLRKHQRDVLVKIDKVRRLSIEVKALTPAAFERHSIQVGQVEKYKEKGFKIYAIVLINQATGEAWAASGNVSEMLRQRSANRDGTYSYAIERSKLTPLDIWVDATKDIYGLS